MQNLAALTGKGYSDWDVVTNEEQPVSSDEQIASSGMPVKKRDDGILFATLGVMALLSLATIRIRKKEDS